MLYDNNSSIKIGDDCLFSHAIMLFSSDGHAVFTKDNKQAYNNSEPVIIGSHVWIGYNVTITKGCVIADNSVVGAGSVVLGQFTEPNVIIAGNPGRVLKRNIDWDELNPYIYNEKLNYSSL